MMAMCRCFLCGVVATKKAVVAYCHHLHFWWFSNEEDNDLLSLLFLC